MASRPLKLPTWNTDSTNRVEPSSGQKASGWTLSQASVTSYWNWLLFTIFSWIEWLALGPRVEKLPMTAGRVVNGSTNVDVVGTEITSEGNMILAASNREVYWEIPATVGRRITDVTLRVVPAGVGDVVKLDVKHNGVSVGDSSSSGGGLQTVAVNDLEIDVDATSKTIVVVSFTAFATGAELATLSFTHDEELP